MNKRDVLQILESMPEEIDPDELMYRIWFLQKLEAAERDAEAGNIITHAELVRRSEEWLK